MTDSWGHWKMTLGRVARLDTSASNSTLLMLAQGYRRSSPDFLKVLTTRSSCSPNTMYLCERVTNGKHKIGANVTAMTPPAQMNHPGACPVIPFQIASMPAHSSKAKP